MPSDPPERRRSLCMATAEDRRVRLQGYADAKTLDRALRADLGPRARLRSALSRVRALLAAPRERRSGPPAAER